MMNRKKTGNRRGDIVLPEVVRLVIGVIVIIGLIYLGTQLFGLFKKDNEHKNAEVLINEIYVKANSLSDGEEKSFSIKRIDGWSFVAWNKDNPNKPEECRGNACICICPSPEGLAIMTPQVRDGERVYEQNPDKFSEIAESCNQLAACRFFENFNYFSSVGSDSLYLFEESQNHVSRSDSPDIVNSFNHGGLTNFFIKRGYGVNGFEKGSEEPEPDFENFVDGSSGSMMIEEFAK